MRNSMRSVHTRSLIAASCGLLCLLLSACASLPEEKSDTEALVVTPASMKFPSRADSAPFVSRFALMALFAKTAYRRDILDDNQRGVQDCAYVHGAAVPDDDMPVEGHWARLAQKDACYSNKGLYFETYVHTNPQTGKHDEAVIAIRGTEAPSIRDWLANFSGVLFFIPTEYDLARESAVPLARRLHAEGMRVYLSGHSLGGGIAQSIAYQLEPELGVEAFTFDTSPVTNWTRLNADHLVKNTDPKIYRVFMNKEALENLRSFTTKFNTLRFGRSDYEFNFVNKPPVDAHSMSHLACQMAARVSAGGAEHDYPQASARRLLGKTYLCDPKSVSIDPQLMAAGN